MSGERRLVITLVVVLLIASGLCFYIASSLYSEWYLTALPPAKVSHQAYELIAFDQRDNLLGLSMKDGKFQVDRYSSNPEQKPVRAAISYEGPKPAQWMLSADGRTLAWLTGVGQISIQRVPFDGLSLWPHPKSVTAPGPLVSFGVLDDGSTIAMALARGELVRKNSMTGETQSALNLGGRIDWAEIRGDYAAVRSSGKLRLFHFIQETWSLLEEWPEVKDIIELRLPAAGQVMGLMESSVRIRNETLQAPGKLTDVAVTDQGRVIVSGAFDGLYILPGAKSEPYQIADAPPGMQIAASTHALGYTGKSGTVMIALEYKSRLTPAGRTMVTIATCLIVAAMLIALAFLILDMQGYDGKKSRKVSKQDGVLPKPPPGLIEAIASGKTTLWAGAGVSAGSGYSLRTPFLSSVFQTARVESWTSTGQIEQSRKLVAEGKCEQALDNFIAADPVMRIRVHELFQATFHRFAAVNDLQLQLAKLPFQAAITTNYDCLLDRTSAPWAVHTVNVNAPASVLGPESQVFVKLYGDFAAASPPILGRRDFRAALGRNPEFLRAFGRLFTTRPVFFIGASIEGLLVDLELLEAPQPPAAVEHYCVTGVVSGNWKPAAAQLKSKYNIEVLACDAMHIQAQLKQFLAELAEGVEQRLAPAVSEAETQTVS